MTDLEILRAARAKIATPETWCTGAFARAADGRDLSPNNPDACAWCAMGALRSVGLPRSYTFDRYTFALFRIDAAGVVALNDTSGHAAVLAMFDAAIARLEAAGE